MKRGVMCRRAKLYHLKKYWKESLKDYIEEIVRTKNNPEKELLSDFKKKYDPGLIDKFLFFYLDRCVYMHALAIFQFRKATKGLTTHELLDL